MSFPEVRRLPAQDKDYWRFRVSGVTPEQVSIPELYNLEALVSVALGQRAYWTGATEKTPEVWLFSGEPE